MGEHRHVGSRELRGPIGLDSPVTVEVFTVARSGERVLLTGPCGAAPWQIQAGPGERPLETARRIVEGSLDGLLLLHSTSWRYENDAVVLSFVAVITASAIGDMEVREVGHADLARGEARAAPEQIDFEQVIEHGLRHLAWLVGDDDVVKTALDAGWHDLLGGWVPEPFRQLR